MTTKQLPVDSPKAQEGIYRVALSLDSFLVNGIQFGVLQPAAADGFLERTANALLSDLASLEEQVPAAPVAVQPRISELLASLRAKCQELIDLVTGLCSFRTVPLGQVRQAVSQIPILRQSCVQRIQELEVSFGTAKPFYQSRPQHATTSVNDFLNALDQLFADDWNASR